MPVRKSAKRLAHSIYSIESNIRINKKYLEEGILKETLGIRNQEYDNVRRFRRGAFFRKDLPKFLYYYKDDGDCWILPRNFPVTDFCPAAAKPGAVEDLRKSGETVKWNHKIALRDYQSKWVKKNPEFLDHEDIVVQMPCGHGKTVMAIYRSHAISKATLVLVPTIYLAEQWMKVLSHPEKGVTDAKAYFFKSTDKSIPLDADFYVCSLDLFTLREFPKEFIDRIGHVVLDEAHRVGADQYIPILDQIPARYRTALTATFRREDGVHNILAYHFGTPLYMDYQFPKVQVYPMETGVHFYAGISRKKPHEHFLDYLDRLKVPYTQYAHYVTFAADEVDTKQANKDFLARKLSKTAYTEIVRRIKDARRINYSLTESVLCEHSGRMKKTLSLIQKCLDAGRTVLFLSKRKNALIQVYKFFKKYKPVLIISETNKRTKEEQEYLDNECRLVCGVSQLAKEGLDIDRLDTLVLHLPIKDTEQAIGRVARILEGKKQPICFYLKDNTPLTMSVFMKARRFIKINGELQEPITLNQVDSVLWKT